MTHDRQRKRNSTPKAGSAAYDDLAKRRTREFPLVAFVPHQIEADWEPRYAHLAGFPLNLMYAAVRSTDRGSMLMACTYWLDPSTYEDDSSCRKMWYVPRHESPYWVCVTFDAQLARWTIAKYRRDELVCLAAGAKFNQAMLQTMTSGLRSDEPPDPD